MLAISFNSLSLFFFFFAGMYMNAAAHMNTCAVFHLMNIHVLNECQADSSLQY